MEYRDYMGLVPTRVSIVVQPPLTRLGHIKAFQEEFSQ